MAYIIVGSSPGRNEEERQRAIASGVNPADIRVETKPIVQPDGTISRPVGDYPETQLTGGGKFTGTGIMPITGTSITPTTDLSKQITTPTYQPPYDISKLGGFAMTPEEISGGQSGIKAYQERTAKLYATDTYAKTPEETKVQTLSERLQAIQDELAGKPTYRTQQEAAYGVPEKQATIRDLEAQITTLKNEMAAIPLQAAGVGVTAGMLGAKQAEQQRQIAVRALTLNSLYEAARGNLLNAQAMADRAVEQKYAPLEAESEAKTANFNLIIRSPEFSINEKKRAITQREIQMEKENEISTDKKVYSEILKLSHQAISEGITNTFILQSIQNAIDESGKPSLAKAQQIYAQAIQPIMKQKAIPEIKDKDLTKLLSVDEATKFGVPYGTTKSEVIGKVPAAISQLGIEATKTRENAISGLSALKVVEEEINKDMNILLKAAIPGAIFARKFETARKEASDVITRLRTGAALNESEERFYKSQLPSVLDYKNPEAIKYKIELFRNLFTRLKESSPIQSSQQQNNDPLGIR